MRTWGSGSRSIDCAVWRRRDSPTDGVGSTSVARTQYPGGSRPGSLAARPLCRVKHPGRPEVRSAARRLQLIDDAARRIDQRLGLLRCEHTGGDETLRLVGKGLHLIPSRLALIGVELGPHLLQLVDQTIGLILGEGSRRDQVV